MLLLIRFLGIWRGGQVPRAERGGCGESFGRARRVTLGSCRVLLLLPANVIPVGSSSSQLHIFVMRESLVAGEQLFHKHWDGPAVQQYVVVAPDEVVRVVRHAD